MGPVSSSFHLVCPYTSFHTLSCAFLSPQVVYTGPTPEAVSHFSALGYVAPSPTTSIADHMLDTVIKAPPEEVCMETCGGWVDQPSHCSSSSHLSIHKPLPLLTHHSVISKP